MNFIFFFFCKLKKPQKTWISFFTSLLKTSKKHEFHFCKLKKPQKTWISFLASLKNLKKHQFHFWQGEFSGRGVQKWVKNRFSIRRPSICIVWPSFKVRYVHTILKNVPHTQNIFLACIENFLDGVEVLIDLQIQ